MKTIYRFIRLFVFGSLVSVSFAQTQHSGLVSSIEAKAKEILSLQKEIASSKEQISDLEKDRESERANARARLDGAINHINTDPTWINRKQTAEEGWREHSPGTCSAGGPPPICPVSHWYRADVAESIKEFEARKEAYLKPYKDAIERAGKGQLSIIDNLYDRIEKMESDIEKLKAELIALSKRYQDAVEKEAKEKSVALTRDLISVVADIHQTEDAIADYEQKILENDRQESQRKRDAVAKVEAQIKQMKAKLERDIARIEERQILESQQGQAAIEQCRDRIARNDKEIASSLYQISNYKGNEQGKAQLEARRDQLRSANYTERQRIAELEAQIKASEEKTRSSISLIRDELFKLDTDESGLRREAEALVEEAFEAKRSVLEASRQAKVEREIQLRGGVSERTSQLTAIFNKWTAAVDQERIRVMRACASVDCSCHGSYVVNEANIIWSKDRDCIGQLLRMRSQTEVVHGCEGSLAYYNAIYSGAVASESASDEAQAKRKRIEGRLGSLLHSY